MDIRKKSLIILSGIIIVVILIFIVFSSTIFLDSYRNLESDHVRDNMDLILKNSNTEIANLNSTVGDWGPWDDTYMFVNGDNPSYIANNLIPATYDNLYLNFVAIVNNEGKIVYGQGYDLKNHELTPLRPDLVAELAKSDSPLKNTNISARVGGLLDLPGGMVLVASHPIVKSDYSGEPVGSIIMGRYIDAAEISRFSADSRHSISVIPVKETPRVSDEEDSLAGSGAEEPRNGSGAPIIFTHAIDRETVEGTTVLPDIYGNETILFSLQMPRDIYNQGGRTVLSSIFFQLVILFGLGILIIWLIDSQVLLRIATTNREIAQITEQKTPGGRVTVNGHDEISQLATSINTMLDQIDTSHAALSESEQRFRELAEQFPEIMVEVDTRGIPTFVNHAASSIFIFIYGGLKKPWSIFDLVAPEDRERFREDFSRILHGESMTGNEYVALKKDGTRFAVILYSTPIIKNGRITGVRIFAGDISERKRMEDELRKINEKMSLLSSITRHDILNQLTALRGYLYLSHEHLSDAKTLENFLAKEEIIAHSIEHHIRFAKDYEAMGSVPPVWENVYSIIRRATVQLSMRDVSVEVERKDCEIFADPLAEKVFYNLIHNALRYGGAGMTTIRFRFLESDAGLVIVCEDNGVGISAEDKERIFVRGFGKNTGLGLFLSREALSITGITIRENGMPGTAAHFEILVPPDKFRFGRDGPA